MKNSKVKFGQLLTQMQPLQADEKGKLKGGFEALPSISSFEVCVTNGAGCVCTGPSPSTKGTGN